MFNWKEIQTTLQPIIHILTQVGLFLLLYLALTLALLIFSYLWRLTAKTLKIAWANFKAPWQKKPVVKVQSEPEKPDQPTPELNPHESAINF